MAGGRYATHDLLRAYAVTAAHDRLPEPVRRPAHGRVADFYLHTTINADRLLNPGQVPIMPSTVPENCRPLAFQDEEAASTWLNDQLPCLLATADVAARPRV